jgi:hypothetical protein
MLIHFNYTFFGHYPDFVAKTLPKQTSSQLTPPKAAPATGSATRFGTVPAASESPNAPTCEPESSRYLMYLLYYIYTIIIIYKSYKASQN